jgi:hypothetical protein
MRDATVIGQDEVVAAQRLDDTDSGRFLSYRSTRAAHPACCGERPILLFEGARQHHRLEHLAGVRPVCAHLFFCAIHEKPSVWMRTADLKCVQSRRGAFLAHVVQATLCFSCLSVRAMVDGPDWYAAIQQSETPAFAGVTGLEVASGVRLANASVPRRNERHCG